MDRKIERKPWWRRYHYWLLAIVVSGILLGIVLFSKPGRTYRISNQFLTVQSVVRDSFVVYTNVTGTIEPGKVVFLEAVEGGRVEEILVEEGTLVTKEKPLVRLSNNNLMLEISNNEALVARAINDLRTARLQMEMNAMQMQTNIVRLQSELFLLHRDFKNNKEFYKEKLISEDHFLKSQEAYQSAIKQMELLRKTYTQDSIYRRNQIRTLEESARQMEENQKYIRQRLSNLTVKSPADGELASIDIEEGQVISYGTRMGKINIVDTYKIRARIDEHYISQVHKGLIGLCDFREKTFPATITKIYSEVENGMFAVDFSFTDTINQSFRIGQTCRIKLELGQSEPGTLLPRGAFFQSTGGRWVFVVNENQTGASRRFIRIGRHNPEYYEVLEGLSPGEKVITSSYENYDRAEALIFK